MARQFQYGRRPGVRKLRVDEYLPLEVARVAFGVVGYFYFALPARRYGAFVVLRFRAAAARLYPRHHQRFFSVVAPAVGVGRRRAVFVQFGRFDSARVEAHRLAARRRCRVRQAVQFFPRKVRHPLGLQLRRQCQPECRQTQIHYAAVPEHLRF